MKKGGHLSKEHKRKISKAKKGQHRSEKTRRKISENRKGQKNNLGKHWKLSKETRQKMSKANKGEKGSNWRGGINSINNTIRSGLEFRLWREAVFARDNWICQKCVKRSGMLHAHHILNFAEHPELRFAIDNGITLCKKCHTEFHKKYGTKNNTKEQLKEFLIY